MRRSMPPFAAAALSAAWLLAVPVAEAQTQPAPPTMTEPTITDQKLDAAAAALERVVDLQKTYKEQLATAKPSEKERVVDEANDALEKAITEQGLSLDEYSEIMEVAQADPEVREKLLQRVHRPVK
jgi:hypothetical protein